MSTITVPKDQFKKVLDDVDALIEDVAVLMSQDELAKRRLSEIQKNPSLGKSEQELDSYLKKRGV